MSDGSSVLGLISACGWCGDPFEVRHWRQLFCSRICNQKTASARRRATQRGKPAHKIYPRDIFERDGWVCHICAEPIDRAARAKEQRAPALDHLIPISHPDYPGHIAPNLAAAHWSCNSAKGPRAEAEDFALYERLSAGQGPGAPIKRRPWTHSGQNHCMKGHLYTRENTYWRPDGAGRQCKRCIMDRQRARYAKAGPAVTAARIADLRERVGRMSGHRPITRNRVIRAWAHMNGIDVRGKGKPPRAVVEAFDRTCGKTG